MQLEGQRVSELADELGYNKQELVTTINSLELGITVDNFMSRLSDDEVSKLKDALENLDETPDEEDGAEEAAASQDIGPTIRRGGDDDDAEAEADDAGADAEMPGGVGVRKRDDDEESTDEQERADAPVAEESEEIEETEESESEETPDAEEETEAADAVADSGDDQEKADEAESEDEPDLEAETDDTEESADEELSKEDAQVDDEAAEPEVEDEPVKTPESDAPAAEKDEAPAEDVDGDGSGQAGTSQQRPPKEQKEDGAKVTGQINEDVIQQRLQAEDKDFSPGPKKGKNKKDKDKDKGGGDEGSSRRSPARRQVVEGSDLYDEDSSRRNRRSNQNQQKQSKTEITEAAEHKRVIEMEDVITVGDLAEEMAVKAGDVAMKLLESGMQATVNTTLDYETATLVADEYGYTVENIAFDISDFYDTEPDDDEVTEPRPPVVTVMGHVDHGKTTLLDAIRRSHIADAEAGGITQHIGAYQVDAGEGRVTFLDTPGHEAFTALRARGAKATDIVVLVVAADDGVMPQTVEAINHAQEAGVPILVAINKIDKPTANPERIKQALTEYELVPEEWGGTTLYVEVSALKETNIDGLLESVELQAEIEDFKANPNRNAQGLIIEAELDTGRGPVATCLVQRGSLKQGDIIVSGQYYGSVRTMVDDTGETVDKAGPSEPVEITGLDGVPEAGEPFFVVEDESDAQRITEHVEEQRRKEVMADRAKEVTAGSIEDLSAMIQEGDLKELKVIVKGDVQGSVEALEEAMNNLGNDEARVQVIHAGVGSVTENDVNLAASSDEAAIIIGFNVRPDRRAAELAEEQGVKVLTHSVIYDAINQIRSILEGLLEPIVEERVLGRAEVRETFSSNKAGTIAGLYVTDGKVTRDAHARLIRDGRVVYDTEIESLQRFEDDVKEVKEGYECGLVLQNYDDIKVEDEMEFYEYEEVSATLGD